MTDAPAEFLDRWQLTQPEQVADTGHAHVWKVQSPDGAAALKLYRREDRGNEGPGTRLLQAWQDRGAVRVLQDAGKAVLMEWASGPSLGDIARAGDPDRAVGTLAEVAHRLHQDPVAPVKGLKDLDTVFAPLTDLRFAADCPRAFQVAMIRAAALARDLLQDPPAPVPLHGDLHPDNVILTQAGPRVIDAKGYLGDPAFELANALRHPKGMPDLVRQPQQVDTCLTRYSDALNVARNRLAKWAAAKCALSIFWRSGPAIARDPEVDLLSLLLRAADQ